MALGSNRLARKLASLALLLIAPALTRCNCEETTVRNVTVAIGTDKDEITFKGAHAGCESEPLKFIVFSDTTSIEQDIGFAIEDKNHVFTFKVNGEEASVKGTFEDNTFVLAPNGEGNAQMEVEVTFHSEKSDSPGTYQAEIIINGFDTEPVELRVKVQASTDEFESSKIRVLAGDPADPVVMKFPAVDNTPEALKELCLIANEQVRREALEKGGVDPADLGQFQDLVKFDFRQNPAADNLGRIPIGTTAKASFKVENTGDGEGTVYSVTVTPVETDPSPFSVNPAKDITVASGATEEITVHFEPRTVGSHSAAIGILTDDGSVCGPGEVKEGELPVMVFCAFGSSVGGGLLDVSPNQLSFSGVNPGETSAPKVVTITNNGEAPVMISNIEIQQPGTSFAFKLDGGAVVPTNLTPGGNIAVQVTYTNILTEPNASGTLVVTADINGGTTFEVELLGGAMGIPAIEPEDLTLDFAGESSPATKQFKVGNIGSGTFNLTAIELDGSSLGDWKIAATDGSSQIAAPGEIMQLDQPVAPGETYTYEVTWTQTPVAPLGFVNIHHDAGINTPIQITLINSKEGGNLPPGGQVVVHEKGLSGNRADFPLTLPAILELDASGVIDPEGDTISFAWELVSAPNGATVGTQFTLSALDQPKVDLNLADDPANFGDWVFFVQWVDLDASGTPRRPTPGTATVAFSVRPAQ